MAYGVDLSDDALSPPRKQYSVARRKSALAQSDMFNACRRNTIFVTNPPTSPTRSLAADDIPLSLLGGGRDDASTGLEILRDAPLHLTRMAC